MDRKCPLGVEHPDEAIKSYVQTREPVSDKTILFYCPCGEDFNLKHAMKAGMFTEEEKGRLLAEAERINLSCQKEGDK